MHEEAVERSATIRHHDRARGARVCDVGHAGLAGERCRMTRAANQPNENAFIAWQQRKGEAQGTRRKARGCWARRAVWTSGSAR